MSTVNNAASLPGKKLHDGMIKSRKTRAGDLVIALICLIAMLICLLPMVHVLACSLSSADALVRNDVFLWPKGWNVEAYKTVMTTEKYVRSLGWTAVLTVICTLLSLFLTICTAYPLIYPNLRGGKVINFIILFTMYFSAGTIPSYILLNNIHFLNTPWALIVPNCISVFNVIIMRSFFYGVPDSLREAAEIDGANDRQIFFRITIPNLRTILTYTLVTSLIGGLSMYDIPKMLNNGNPNNSTLTATMFIYNQAFQNSYMYARGAAASMILFLIIAFFSAIIFFMMRDRK